jgi:hypothetical protein
VEAGDLLLHNVPAQQVSGDGAGPYTFVFNEPATGLVQVAWAAGHGIEDLAAVPNAFAGGAWTYVLNPGIAYDFAVSNLVHISLDGVGSAYLEQYMNNAPASFPNFVRLRNEGAATLNARTDYDITVTLPNHADMFTGRPAQQPAGWGNTTHHGLTIDSDNGTTIHYASTGNPNVPYKMSVFDVAHDHGLSTAFLYSKQSLTIFARSWDAAHGAADVVDADNGTGKIDVVFNSTTGASYGPTAPVVDEFLKRVVTNSLWQYTFMHFDDGDATGHASSWGSATYSNGVRVADQQIGRVLEGLQANPAYSNRTVVIVTADHGGGSPSSSHNVNSSPLNYRIPLFVWGPGIPAGVDLYTLFANRADPGGDRADYGTPGGLHPLRDGDTGNLALTLLGLPTIPGSSLIPIFGHPPVPLAVTKTDSGVTIAWLAEASDYDLQFTPVLGANAQWQTVTNGVADLLPLRVFTFQPGAERPTGFFRLQKR